MSSKLVCLRQVLGIFLLPLILLTPVYAQNVCIRWQQTNFPDSCAQTGIRAEGTAFFHVNNVPVPVVTISPRISVSCPDPHFENKGFSCGTPNGGSFVQQQLFQGCFDKAHLLLGDNSFYFGVTVSSAAGIGFGLDSNFCVHMIHSVLLKLPNGDDILLFGVTHAGQAVTGQNVVNFSLSKIDPEMAAILHNHMATLKQQLTQAETLLQLHSQSHSLEQQISELEKLASEVRALERETQEDLKTVEQKLAQLKSQRGNLSYRQNLVDESELLVKIHAMLEQVHSGHVDASTIPELLKLVLTHKDIFRNRDLVHLEGFVEEVAERTKGAKDDMNRAMRASAEKLEGMQKKLDDIASDKNSQVLSDLNDAQRTLDVMFQQKIQSRSQPASCNGAGPAAFRQIAEQSLRSIQQTVHGNTVVDRRVFLKEYRKWMSQQILASKTLLATQNVCREDLVALEQTNNQVRKLVLRHYDDTNGWFLQSNISHELRTAVQEKLAIFDPARAKVLREELNFWSYAERLSPQQQLIADSLLLILTGYYAERKSGEDHSFELLRQLNELIDQAISAIQATATMAADIGIGLIPLVGDFNDFCEATSGKHLCLPSGEDLSIEDRVYAAAGMVFGSRIFWKGISNSVSGIVRIVADKVSDLGKRVGSRSRWNQISKKYGIPRSITDELARLKWDIPDEVLDKIPRDLVGVPKLNQDRMGIRWSDPKEKGHFQIRIDKGDPNAPFSHQKYDHVRITSYGKVIGINGGEVVKTTLTPKPSNAREAHIPLHEWKTWKQWDHP